MQITLTQSGGLTGKKLTASANSTLTDKEWQLLIDTIKRPADKGKKKDAFSYSLKKNNDENSATSIDIASIPDAHNDLFKKLFDGLKPVQ